ncbi:RRXRR domain-containing protein [Streptomyces sp. NPDC057302]|uniref:RRXRR domain-containing protein n=1 Tax=Streptomyces sp. NPDC057302 TaxID=3346094 RepID=UPI003636549A
MTGACPVARAGRVTSPSHQDHQVKGRRPSMTTFSAGEQTHRAVLPQQPALESVRADTLRSEAETAHGLPATARGTGGEHGRGETGGHRVTPRRRHAESTAAAVDSAEIGSGDAPSEYGGGAGASRIFVLARDRQPLMPCHPARARELLDKGRAVVHRQVPFTIRLKDRAHVDSTVDGVQLRIDPGSKTTGLALTDEKKESGHRGDLVLVRRGLMTAELRHRGGSDQPLYEAARRIPAQATIGEPPLSSAEKRQPHPP